jgi:phosphoribosylformimino-5-aminoimidazole carboxamide ribotide isomerase
MSNSFDIFPAIDLRGRQVVRLKEGDPARLTHYGSDPASTAQKWLDAGARWLHVINLDGAFEESDNANRNAVEQILQTAARYQARVQLGGGLRDLASAAEALQMGVERVIFGTLAVSQPQTIAEALQRWGSERVAVSLDARDGIIQVRGWQETSGLQTVDFALQLKALGLQWLVFTDIARDGLQTGINLNATANLAQETGLKVVASGGVHHLDDVRSAQKAGLAGCIVGRALYEGSIDPLELFKGEA